MSPLLHHAMRTVHFILFMVVAGLSLAACSNQTEARTGERPRSDWQREWPNTDFSKSTIRWSEIAEGGPSRDGIPSIDRPRFYAVNDRYPMRLGLDEPVIAVEYQGRARAYPLRILTVHEIVNDVIGDMPIAITYCPLCNSSVVFDRRIDGRTLDFGTTGKLRYSDLVMYDRQTESWWQQFLGEAIVGSMTGRGLRIIPSRVESISRFRTRFPQGMILAPVLRDRAYQNPYVRYDGRAEPFPFFRGKLPTGIEPMARVVAVGKQAWTLRSLARRGEIVQGDLVLRWVSGQNSALDTRDISRGRDVGNVTVQRRTKRGLVDVPYDVTFAFAFHAFRPNAPIVDR